MQTLTYFPDFTPKVWSSCFVLLPPQDSPCFFSSRRPCSSGQNLDIVLWQLCWMISFANTVLLSFTLLYFAKEKWTRSELQNQEDKPSARMCHVRACNPSTHWYSSLGWGHVPVSGQSLESLTQQVPAGGSSIQRKPQLSLCDCTSHNLIQRSAPNPTDGGERNSPHRTELHMIYSRWECGCRPDGCFRFSH